MQRAQVVIIGAGPTGLMLAIELGRRGVATCVLSDNLATSDTPKATVTQARTMEHFRRLGLAEQVRNTGTPANHATDIVYCSRITWHELARHRLPSPAEARRLVRAAPATWHTPELTHRSSQMWIEPILLAECRRLASVELLLGWRFERFADTGGEVRVEATRIRDGHPQTFHAAYLVGCDGAASAVRAQLGIGRGETSAIKEFKGRAMCSVHARAPRLFDCVPFAKGWLYAAVNSTQRGSCISLDGNEFKFSFWRPDDWTAGTVSKHQLGEAHFRMFGRACEFDIIGYKLWRGGASLVADGYGRGRVLLAGDSAHLFTPSAGLGYNAGIDDAVNLGWKLAAMVHGWGGPGLLASYELECRPEALRRTRFAAECAERLALFKPSPALDQDTEDGARDRARAAAYFAQHLPLQYDIPGINFGARFDDSPIISSDPHPAPPGSPNHYVPSGKPGGRAPHAWLADGRSLFDQFGFDFTLLKLGAADVAPLQRAAQAMQLPLSIVELAGDALAGDALRDVYEADLVLIRPDQIVAWRGVGTPADGAAILRKVTGWA
jgi:2-polyprenyl-6-methoxyphenol hydroxylase-like FAD-dependent oxidoreductase